MCPSVLWVLLRCHTVIDTGNSRKFLFEHRIRDPICTQLNYYCVFCTSIPALEWRSMLHAPYSSGNADDWIIDEKNCPKSIAEKKNSFHTASSPERIEWMKFFVSYLISRLLKITSTSMRSCDVYKMTHRTALRLCISIVRCIRNWPKLNERADRKW